MSITVKAMIHDSMTDTVIPTDDFGFQRFKNVLYEAYCIKSDTDIEYIDGFDRKVRYPKILTSKMSADYPALQRFLRAYDYEEMDTASCKSLHRELLSIQKYIADDEAKDLTGQLLDTLNNAIQNHGFVIIE